MWRFIGKRILLSIVVIVSVSIISFSLIYLSGDPASALAGEAATPAEVQAVRVTYGLNRPIYVQYGSWLWRALHGDFGRSYFLHEPILHVLETHLVVTAKLGAGAIVFALLLSVSMGVVAALRRGTIIDRSAMGVAVIGQSAPSFLVGLFLIFVFSVVLRWLPSGGSGSWEAFILPSITLGYYSTPVIMRLTRAGMLDALASDHIRTARAFGLKRWRIVLRHALRSAIMPVVSLSAVEFGFMLGGSIITETVFSMNGLGYLAWQSIDRGDLPVIQGILLWVAAIYASFTLLTDIINGFLDPRVHRA